MRPSLGSSDSIDVLIAEDDAGTRQTLRQLFEAEGYSCAEADDGRDAVEIARQRPRRNARARYLTNPDRKRAPRRIRQENPMTQVLVELEPPTAPKKTLTSGADLLEHALAEDVTGRERDWAAGVAQTLRQIERELRRYRNNARTQDGHFADLDRMRPTLFRQWNILCLHYGDLLKRVHRLREDVQRAAEAFQPVGEALAAAALTGKGTPVSGEVPVFGAIRQQAREILIDLNKSREAETALLLESVVTDIGVGD